MMPSPLPKELAWWKDIRQSVTRANVHRTHNFGGTFTWSHLHEAANLGYTNCARWLIVTRGANVNQKCAPKNRTPLHIAVCNGHEEMVRMLLDYKANIEAVDWNGGTALLLATQFSNVRVVDILLQRGASPTNVRYPNYPF